MYMIASKFAHGTMLFFNTLRETGYGKRLTKCVVQSKSTAEWIVERVSLVVTSTATTTSAVMIATPVPRTTQGD